MTILKRKFWIKKNRFEQIRKTIILKRTNLKRTVLKMKRSTQSDLDGQHGQQIGPWSTVNKSDQAVKKSDLSPVNKSDLLVNTVQIITMRGGGIRPILVYTWLCSVANKHMIKYVLYICVPKQNKTMSINYYILSAAAVFHITSWFLYNDNKATCSPPLAPFFF